MWIFYFLLVTVILAGGVYFWQNILPDINTRNNLSLLGKEAPPYVALYALPVTHDNVLEAWQTVYHADAPASIQDAMVP